MVAVLFFLPKPSGETTSLGEVSRSVRPHFRTVLVGLLSLAVVAGIYFAWPKGGQAKLDKDESAESASTEQGDGGRASPARIDYKDVAVEAGATVYVLKTKRCSTNNRDPNTSSMSREGNTITFTNKDTEKAEVRFWFFDEGGDCRSDGDRLIAERAFF